MRIQDASTWPNQPATGSGAASARPVEEPGACRPAPGPATGSGAASARPVEEPGACRPAPGVSQPRRNCGNESIKVHANIHRNQWAHQGITHTTPGEGSSPAFARGPAIHPHKIGSCGDRETRPRRTLLQSAGWPATGSGAASARPVEEPGACRPAPGDASTWPNQPATGSGAASARPVEEPGACRPAPGSGGAATERRVRNAHCYRALGGRGGESALASRRSGGAATERRVRNAHCYRALGGRGGESALASRRGPTQEVGLIANTAGRDDGSEGGSLRTAEQERRTFTRRRSGEEASPSPSRCPVERGHAHPGGHTRHVTHPVVVVAEPASDRGPAIHPHKIGRAATERRVPGATAQSAG
ncbi:MAG: hypothetical protein WDW38_011077 [Sanguina aurantia]